MGWSCRLAPTPGRSSTTSTPTSRRCVAGPIPESMSSWGEPTAPAVSTTPPEHPTVPVWLAVEYRTPGHRPPPGAPPAVDAHLVDERIGHHVKVRACQRGREVGVGGTLPPPVHDGEVG